MNEDQFLIIQAADQEFGEIPCPSYKVLCSAISLTSLKFASSNGDTGLVVSDHMSLIQYHPPPTNLKQRAKATPPFCLFHLDSWIMLFFLLAYRATSAWENSQMEP